MRITAREGERGRGGLAATRGGVSSSSTERVVFRAPSTLPGYANTSKYNHQNHTATHRLELGRPIGASPCGRKRVSPADLDSRGGSNAGRRRHRDRGSLLRRKT